MEVLKIFSQSPKIRVGLVNLSLMHCDLLRSALSSESDIVVAGQVENLEELQTFLQDRVPTVALVGSDGRGGSFGAFPFLRGINTLAPSLPQVVMSARLSQDEVVACFRGGARGLLCGSSNDVAALTKCLRCVSAGQIWASTGQLDSLLRAISSPECSRVTDVLGASLLSDREEQVLDLLVSGLSNRELAAVMHLSEHTVKNHLFRIFDKLGVSTRLEAVLYALNHRELKPAEHPIEKSRPAHRALNSAARLHLPGPMLTSRARNASL